MPDTPFAWAYQDGALVPYEALTIHAESMAMRYGLSAFEGIRAYVPHEGGGVRCFALEEHAARLDRTLELVGFRPIEPGSVARAAAALIEANGASGDCYLRVAVNATSLGTLKAEPRTALSASLQPMGRRPWLASGVPLAVAISSRQKPPDEVFPQCAKVVSNYAGPRLAFLEAQKAGFDDVVLTTIDGRLSEAPTANLFLVHGTRLSTPRVGDAILPGITRAFVLRIAAELGLTAEERPLVREDAYAASEAFLCGTGLEFAKISRFDDRTLPADAAVLSQIVSRYFDVVRGAQGAGKDLRWSSSIAHAG